MKIVSTSQMRELDRKTIQQAKIPGEILMQRAGYGASIEILDYVSRLAPKHVKRFVVIAGKGNNGGDAYVTAKYLYEKTATETVVYSVCPLSKLAGDALIHAKKLPNKINCEFRSSPHINDFRNGDIIIDGLLGTGFSGEIREPYSKWIDTVNSLELPVIALDIPSGLDGDSGDASCAIKADLTVTIALPKIGLIKSKGPTFAGKIRCVDIGIPQNFIDETNTSFEMIFKQDARKLLGRIPLSSHKKSRGKLLIVAGSKLYPGAAFLAAKSALRSGCGYLTCAIPDKMPLYNSVSNSLIIRPVSSSSAYFSSKSLDPVRQLLNDSSASVIGPGIGNNKHTYKFVKEIQQYAQAVVYDADALNIFAEYPELAKFKAPTVLTPHQGEMARLAKNVLKIDPDKYDRPSIASLLAEHTNATVVLKGHQTVVAQKQKTTMINSSGSPALSTAGTGDVLSGIIGTFLAQGYSAFDSAITAVFIHGLASELSNKGMRGLNADDLCELIPMAMKEISPFA